MMGLYVISLGAAIIIVMNVARIWLDRMKRRNFCHSFSPYTPKTLGEGECAAGLTNGQTLQLSIARAALAKAKGGAA